MGAAAAGTLPASDARTAAMTAARVADRTMSVPPIRAQYKAIDGRAGRVIESAPEVAHASHARAARAGSGCRIRRPRRAGADCRRLPAGPELGEAAGGHVLR